MKIAKEQAESLRHSILEDNKILYCMKGRPCTETTMCWGLECGDGWLNPIERMSKSLEGLNYLFYPRFRVRVQMDQVKEKFATLTCYYSIVCDPPKWMCIWHDFFQRLFDKIKKTDFKFVEVLDKDAYEEVVEEELKMREEFEKEKKSCARISNVDVYEKDGKFIRRAVYDHPKKTHRVPTRHKLLFKLLNCRYSIENLPARVFNFKPSHSQLCISEMLEDKVRAIVSKAEKECYKICEYCGAYISDESSYSPRCTTRGYIQYLCKDCAAETKNEYIMQGAVYREGREIMSKKDYAAEKAKIEAKFKAAQEDGVEELDDED